VSALRFSAPKGMRDILPADAPLFLEVERAFREVARRFCYGEIRTPHLESTDLFVRTVGETSDIVEKEMYSLETKGGDRLALRPENTAGVVRAYLEHGMHRSSPLQRLFYFGEMFRHESAQKKRFREFTQAGIECFGSPHPEADAEVVSFAAEVYRELGLGDVRVEISTFGCASCRPAFRQKLREYFAGLADQLCADCRRRLDANVFRLLDCKEPRCRALADAAPRIELDDACRAHFDETRRRLNQAGTTYVENPRLVRGLDYYSRTIFEVFPAGGEGRQDALCGGGRYDALAELLGGPPVSAVGFAMGVDRAVMAMKDARAADGGPTVDVYVVAELVEPPAGCAGAQAIARDLRRSGLAVAVDIARRKFPDKQLREASKTGARVAVIVGGNELRAGAAVVKDMVTGEQASCPVTGIVAEVVGRLGRSDEASSKHPL
jgi:histidyl-tRNA synthetase